MQEMDTMRAQMQLLQAEKQAKDLGKNNLGEVLKGRRKRAKQETIWAVTVAAEARTKAKAKANKARKNKRSGTGNRNILLGQKQKQKQGQRKGKAKSR